MPFSSLGLSEIFQEKLIQQGYEKPYPIQEQAIPIILEGKDILGIAQTGSGKTASFALPILQKLLTDKTAKNRHIKALIIVPTRELAIQVNDVFQLFSSDLDRKIKTLAVYGGVSINPQMIQLQGVEDQAGDGWQTRHFQMG